MMPESPKTYRHRQFKKSFISEIKIYIGLQGDDTRCLFEERKEEIKKFFSRFFDADPDDGDFLSKDITFDNGNGMCYTFSTECVVVEIKRKAYKSFLTTGVISAFPMKRFIFNTLGIESILSPVVFKRNLFPFKLKPGMDFPTPGQLWPEVFSKNLIDTPVDEYNEIPGAKCKVEMRQINEGHMSVAFATGIVESPDTCGVVMDIFDAYDNSVKIRESEFDERLLALNDRLFDYFNWAMSESILNLMR